MAQPAYLNDSSSTDTDEDWEQDAQIFAHLVQQANASSSIPRSKAPNIDRGRVEANARLMADYFDENPTYPEKTFKRRFRMSRNLFTRIVYDLYTRYPYFQQQYDATGLPAQEAARKDIERAFGILRKRWNIIKQPSRFMEIPTMRKVMYACIILHNMILENKNKVICVVPNDIPDPPNPQLTEEQRMVNIFQVRNSTIHHNLRADLVEHIWNLDIDF
ncbi:hypothetical protein OSB04_000221 [Centaurea solstitialis]|uniref:Nuclease HARBI1 n=1 Tax=Centaurea solstitialis TaxID=347529 RepID=A0AA38TNM3_9ASTR|nr:hypothetical protein OSB04_000221 [Centaurea solstitialis]